MPPFVAREICLRGLVCGGLIGGALFGGSFFGSDLCENLTLRRAPIVENRSRLGRCRNKVADIDSVGQAVLAELRRFAPIGVAAGIGAHRFDFDDRRLKVFARQRLEIALEPGDERFGEIASDDGGRGKSDLGILSDADEFNRSRGSAGAFFDRLMRIGDGMYPLQNDRAVGLGVGNLGIAPLVRRRLCGSSVLS